MIHCSNIQGTLLRTLSTIWSCPRWLPNLGIVNWSCSGMVCSDWTVHIKVSSSGFGRTNTALTRYYLDQSRSPTTHNLYIAVTDCAFHCAAWANRITSISDCILRPSQCCFIKNIIPTLQPSPTHMDEAFTVPSVKLWNNLPEELTMIRNIYNFKIGPL